MPRKFNIGRQSEQLLNKELHDLFMAMKHINSGPNTPINDEQADIPYGAMWVDPSFGKNILKTYNKNREWEPLFEKYYHPANLLVKPEHPTNGQLWVDTTRNGLIHYYDENTASWVALSALSANTNDVGITGFDNFLNVYPLKPVLQVENQNKYLIPSESVGRMFDGGSYIHPTSEFYDKESEITVSYEDQNFDEQESWIHLNPSRLNICDKKLIKVNKDPNNEKAYWIDISHYNTEFYGIEKGSKKGVLLRHDPNNIFYSDYSLTDNGIMLNPVAYKYEYVYAISYSFSTSMYPGYVLRKSLTVGTEDEIHIGQYGKHPFVFLDGLYLEQGFYNYNVDNGVVKIVNDDIIGKMEMTSVVFQDFSKGDDGQPYEYTINQVNINNTDAIIGPLTANTQAFKKPIAFVSGVMGATSKIYTPEEVVIDGTQATIKNIGPMVDDDIFKVMIAETDGMYVGSGIIDDDKVIKHPDINERDTYIAFVEGIIISPSDMTISEGEIRVFGAAKGQQWVLLRTAFDEETGVVFDEAVCNFTIRIEDNNDNNSYDNCDMATVYVGDGILIDLSAIEKNYLPIKGVEGQVIKYKRLTEDGGAYETYKIWSYEKYAWLDIEDLSVINEIAKIASYFSTKGSISITNTGFVGEPLTYYAYTYNNSIDEPLLYDKRYTTKDSSLYFKTNFNHLFRPNVGALSTYLNGLLVMPTEDSSGNSHFTMPSFEQELNPYDNGEILYIVERPELDEEIACHRETLTIVNRDPDLPNTYNTSISLIPGVVNVFVNGVKIEREEYSLIGEHKIMLHFDIVGGQSNFDANNQETWNKYLVFTDKGAETINCSATDEIIVEVRKDYRLRTQTLSVRYSGQQFFSVQDDGLAESILNTKDYVKIYINGVLYTGDYTINKEAGILVLEDASVTQNLNVDVMERLFTEDPKAYAKYQAKYGKYYAKKIIDTITFEWR